MAIVGAKFTNIQAVEKALLQAFEQWAEEDVNDKHWKKQFQDDKWKYERVTKRKSGGEVGPGPRDIYDLGLLYESGVESYKFEAGSNGAQANWHWDAKNSSGKEYAYYVHEGRGTNAPYERKFTDDISIPSSFFLKEPGKDLLARVQTALDGLSR